jgi:hypothetical protein
MRYRGTLSRENSMNSLLQVDTLVLLEGGQLFRILKGH